MLQPGSAPARHATSETVPPSLGRAQQGRVSVWGARHGSPPCPPGKDMASLEGDRATVEPHLPPPLPHQLSGRDHPRGPGIRVGSPENFNHWPDEVKRVCAAFQRARHGPPTRPGVGRRCRRDAVETQGAWLDTLIRVCRKPGQSQTPSEVHS